MKKIEVVYLKPKQLGLNYGNPRRISPERLQVLKQSIQKLDDFGVVVIDEDNQVISGNQRVKAMIELNIETPILCKKLSGYTDAEKKAINIKANTHDGEWDDAELHEFLLDIKEEFDVDFLGFDEENFNFEVEKIEKEIAEHEQIEFCEKCGKKL